MTPAVGTLVATWPHRPWVEAMRAIDPNGTTHISDNDRPRVGDRVDLFCGITYVIKGVYRGGIRVVRVSRLREEPGAYEDEPICPGCLRAFVSYGISSAPKREKEESAE